MKHALLIEKDTGTRISIPGKCPIGRADDNTVVIPVRHCSRHHCVIYQGLLGSWNLKQFVKEGTGPTVQSVTYVGREGRLTTVVSGQKCKLMSGDELAFGRPKGSEGVEFTHTFWLAEV